MFSFFHTWHLHFMGLIALLLQAGSLSTPIAERPPLPVSSPAAIVQPVVPPPVDPAPPIIEPVPLPDPPTPIEPPVDPRTPPHCGGCGITSAAIRKGPPVYCPMIACYDEAAL